ncbi:MAG TPA: glutathione S-transferase [Myxococcota bacterium]|nr:glutathione S-transferase [Myxococcota bacterium]
MSRPLLLGRRSSFNVQKVQWLLAELGLDFEQRELGGRFGGLDTPEFGALNPHRRVPVLVDGDLAVWESHAILRYLAASHGGESWWPRSPAARSHADRWLDWAETTLQPDFMGIFWGWYRTPEAQRNQPAIAAALRACERHFRLLDAQLESRDHLLGDTLTLADIPTGASLFRYFEMGLPVPHPPRVEAWYRRLCARPAYRAQVMLPFQELFGRLAF